MRSSKQRKGLGTNAQRLRIEALEERRLLSLSVASSEGAEWPLLPGAHVEAPPGAAASVAFPGSLSNVAIDSAQITYGTTLATATATQLATLVERLSTLGVPDRDGNSLKPGRLASDPTLQSALQLFKAMVDPAGDRWPQQQVAELDENSIAWLNAPEAPKWLPLPGTSLFGTSWVIDSLVGTRSLETSRVTSISERVPQQSSDEAGGPAGLSAVVNVTSLSDAHLATIVGELRAAARAKGARLSAVSLVAGEGAGQLVDLDAASIALPASSVPWQTLKATFLPGARSTYEPEGAAAIASSLTAFGEFLGDVSQLKDGGGGDRSLFTLSLPLLTLPLSPNPSSNGVTQDVTLDGLAGLVDLVREQLFRSAADAMDAADIASIDDLEQAFSRVPGATVRTTRSLDQVDIHVDLAQSKSRLLNLDLGERALARNLLLTNPSTAYPTLDVTSTVRLGFTVTLPAATGRGLGNPTLTLQYFSVDAAAARTATSSMPQLGLGLVALTTTSFEPSLHAAVNLVSQGGGDDAPLPPILRINEEDARTSRLADLAALSAGDDAEVKLTMGVRADIGGVDVLGGKGQIILLSEDAFAGDPFVVLNPDPLELLGELQPGDLAAGLEAIGAWLHSLSQTAPLNIPVPFGDGRTLGDVLSLSDRWLAVVRGAQEAAAPAAVTTISGLVDKINASDASVRVGALTFLPRLKLDGFRLGGPTGTDLQLHLLFSLEAEGSDPTWSLSLPFDDLAGIAGTATASVTGSGRTTVASFDATLGIRLEGQKTLGPQTSLASLNGQVSRATPDGRVETRSAGAKLHDIAITLSDESRIEVRFAGEQTVGEVLQTVNDAARTVGRGSAFRATINGVSGAGGVATDSTVTYDHIVFIDDTDGAGTLRVELLSPTLHSLHEAGLGLVGEVGDRDSHQRLIHHGASLLREDVLQRTYLDVDSAGPTLTSTWSVSLDNFRTSYGNADTYGVVFANGTGQSTLTATQRLADPGVEESDARITLAELVAALGVAPGTTSGPPNLPLLPQSGRSLASHAELRASAVLEKQPTVAGTLTVVWNNCHVEGSRPEVTIESPLRDELASHLQRLSANVGETLDEAWAKLQTTLANQAPAWNIPGLGISLGKLLNLDDALGAKVAGIGRAIASAAPTTLADLEAVLEGALGYKGDPGDQVRVRSARQQSGGPRSAAVGDYEVAIDSLVLFDPPLKEFDVPVNVTLPFVTDPAFAGFAATANLNFKTTAKASLHFQVMADTQGAVAIEILPDTTFQSTARIVDDSVALRATLGGIAVSTMGRGVVMLDGDADPTSGGDFAQFTVSYDDKGQVSLASTGGLYLKLPLYMGDQPVGDGPLILRATFDGKVEFQAPTLPTAELPTWAAATDRIAAELEKIEDQVRRLLSGKLLLGDQLEQYASEIVEVSRALQKVAETDLFDNEAFCLAVRTALFETLGPSGSGLLRDGDDPDDSVTISDVIFEDRNKEDGADVRKEGRLKLTLGIDKSDTVDLGLEVPGLPLRLTDAPVAVALELKSTISVDWNETESSAKADSAIRVAATLPDAELSGTFGPFSLSAKDAGSNVTFEYSSGQWSTEGALVLQLKAGVGNPEIFPEIGAALELKYSSEADPTKVAVTLRNVEVSPGQLIAGTIGSAIGSINEAIDPIRPLLDLMTNAIPVLSDLMGSPVTFLDLADASGYITPGTRKFITAARGLSDLLKAADKLRSSPSIVMIDQWELAGTNDPPTPRYSREVQEFIKLASSIPSFEPAAQADGGVTAAAAAKPGFYLDILKEPGSIIDLLLGNDVNVFTYNMPSFEFSYTYTYAPIPVFPPFVFGRFDATAGAKIDLGFGYDTVGLRHYADTHDVKDVLDGFFINDLNGSKERPEFTLFGGVSFQVTPPQLPPSFPKPRGASITAEAGIGGGLFMDVTFDLNDQDGDGKLRHQELVDLGADCMFDTAGRLFIEIFAQASIEASVRILGKERSWKLFNRRETLFDLTLFEFESSCGQPSQEPLATLNSRTGELELSATEGDDKLRVKNGSALDGSVVVSRQGQEQTFSGVRSIKFRGGKGDDEVVVADDVTIPVDLDGGGGDDLLQGGAGDDVLRGGDGKDRLLGNAGSDDLAGGDGADYVDGGEGDDLLLKGGDGDDRLIGGLGNDHLWGDGGDDRLEGGDGEDALRGGSDNDILLGGKGSDRLFGEDGDDSLYAYGDRRTEIAVTHILEGGKGDDTIFGDGGHDKVTDREGNNIVYALGGDDIVALGTGDDLVDLGPGADSLTDEGGSDIVYGGLGPDTVRMRVGADESKEQDIIYAGVGQDGGDPSVGNTIEVAGGSNLIYGDDGPDLVSTSAGRDLIYGLRGNDTIDAGGGTMLSTVA